MGRIALNKIDHITKTVREVCRREELLADMPDNEFFFDRGISSLAVIQMQIHIEEVLKITVPTSDLMEYATINDWIRLYTQVVSATTQVDTPIMSPHGAVQ